MSEGHPAKVARNMKKCRSCGGKGFEKTWSAGQMTDARCHACDGRGVIPKAEPAPVKYVCRECAKRPPFDAIKYEATVEARCDICGALSNVGTVPESVRPFLERDAKAYQRGVSLDRLQRLTWLSDKHWELFSVSKPGHSWRPSSGHYDNVLVPYQDGKDFGSHQLLVKTPSPLTFGEIYTYDDLKHNRAWLDSRALPKHTTRTNNNE